MRAGLKRQLLETACQPYRAVGNFHYCWARGKLGHDPVFAALLEQGILQSHARVLDLGCGRGLLAAWFLAAEQLAASGQWYGLAAPSGQVFHGVDLNDDACIAGNRALQSRYGNRVSLVAGDMCLADLNGFGAITLLDVLHYIPHARQEALLDKIRAALAPGGLLVMRVGNARGGWRFRFSQWVDLAVANMQGCGSVRCTAGR